MGTRKEIIAEIMKWSATWGSPLSREPAEARADQTIKATRPHWGWFVVFMIVTGLWIWFIASTCKRERGYRFVSRSTYFDHGSDFRVAVPVAMAVSAHLKKGQGNAD